MTRKQVKRFMQESMKFRQQLRILYGPTPTVVLNHGPFTFIVEVKRKNS